SSDGDGDTTQYAYDGNGNMVLKVEPKGSGPSAVDYGYSTRYTYDELDQLLSVDETRRGPSSGVPYYLYDANRTKIAQQDADGHLVTYEYDARNELTDTFEHLVSGTITAGTPRTASPGGSIATALHWHYGYDPNGNQDLTIDAVSHAQIDADGKR